MHLISDYFIGDGGSPQIRIRCHTTRLANKIAVVTGAASGMGLGIAQLFTMEGATVVFRDINKTGIAAADNAG